MSIEESGVSSFSKLLPLSSCVATVLVEEAGIGGSVHQGVNMVASSRGGTEQQPSHRKDPAQTNGLSSSSSSSREQSASLPASTNTNTANHSNQTRSGTSNSSSTNDRSHSQNGDTSMTVLSPIDDHSSPSTSIKNNGLKTKTSPSRVVLIEPPSSSSSSSPKRCECSPSLTSSTSSPSTSSSSSPSTSASSPHHTSSSPSPSKLSPPSSSRVNPLSHATHIIPQNSSASSTCGSPGVDNKKQHHRKESKSLVLRTSLDLLPSAFGAPLSSLFFDCPRRRDSAEALTTWRGFAAWDELKDAYSDDPSRAPIDGRVKLGDPSLTHLSSTDFAQQRLSTVDIQRIVLSLSYNKCVTQFTAPFRSKYYAEQLLTDMEVVLRTNTTLRNLQIFYHGGISPRALSLLARILARNTSLETVAFCVHLSPGCNDALAELADALESNTKSNVKDLAIEIVNVSPKHITQHHAQLTQRTHVPQLVPMPMPMPVTADVAAAAQAPPAAAPVGVHHQQPPVVWAPAAPAPALAPLQLPAPAAQLPVPSSASLNVAVVAVPASAGATTSSATTTPSLLNSATLSSVNTVGGIPIPSGVALNIAHDDDNDDDEDDIEHDEAEDDDATDDDGIVGGVHIAAEDDEDATDDGGAVGCVHVASPSEDEFTLAPESEIVLPTPPQVDRQERVKDSAETIGVDEKESSRFIAKIKEEKTLLSSNGQISSSTPCLLASSASDLNGKYPDLLTSISESDVRYFNHDHSEFECDLEGKDDDEDAEISIEVTPSSASSSDATDASSSTSPAPAPAAQQQAPLRRHHSRDAQAELQQAHTLPGASPPTARCGDEIDPPSSSSPSSSSTNRTGLTTSPQVDVSEQVSTTVLESRSAASQQQMQSPLSSAHPTPPLPPSPPPQPSSATAVVAVADTDDDSHMDTENSESALSLAETLSLSLADSLHASFFTPTPAASSMAPPSTPQQTQSGLSQAMAAPAPAAAPSQPQQQLAAMANPSPAASTVVLMRHLHQHQQQAAPLPPEPHAEVGLSRIAHMLQHNHTLESLTITAFSHMYDTFARDIGASLQKTPRSLLELKLHLPLGTGGCMCVVDSLSSNSKLQSIKLSSGDSMMLHSSHITSMLRSLKKSPSLVQIGVFLSFLQPQATRQAKKIETRNYRVLIGHVLCEAVQPLPRDIASLIADFTPIIIIR